MEKVYLDNSATTPLCPAARTAMQEAMETFGNPSSLHGEGQAAHALLMRARGQVGRALGLREVLPGQLVFTSCGTEASNTAIFGTVYAKARRTGRKIITTDSEHPSVENCMKKLESDGFEVVRVSTRGGVLDTEQALSALDDQVVLVSMMLVNNETGARYCVEDVFSVAKAKNPAVITHCDAVQGFLKCPFTPKSLGADLITVSAHKIHGPKGVGALYVDPKLLTAKKIVPYLIGGGQEAGLRSGTENMIGIVGFGAAAEVGAQNAARDMAHMADLRRYGIEKCRKAGFTLNLPVAQTAPHIISLNLPAIKSQTMLNFLSARGICVSSGSACSSHAAGQHISASLSAFGLTPAQADCVLRISLSPANTEADLDALTDALTEGAAKLVRIKR